MAKIDDWERKRLLAEARRKKIAKNLDDIIGNLHKLCEELNTDATGYNTRERLRKLELCETAMFGMRRARNAR